MDDVAVRLEHVDLLDGLDGLGVELLQGAQELGVVTAGATSSAGSLSAGSTLATIKLILLAHDSFVFSVFSVCFRWERREQSSVVSASLVE